MFVTCISLINDWLLMMIGAQGGNQTYGGLGGVGNVSVGSIGKNTDSMEREELEVIKLVTNELNYHIYSIFMS